MVTTCPCGQPGSFPPCVSLEVLTTPNRRYHGRMSFALPLPACATPRSKRVFAHTQDHCFVVFKDVQLRFALRSMRIRRNLVCTRQMLNISVCPFFWFWVCFLNRMLYCLLNAIPQSPHPTYRKQVNCPFAVQHPTI